MLALERSSQSTDTATTPNGQQTDRAALVHEAPLISPCPSACVVSGLRLASLPDSGGGEWGTAEVGTAHHESDTHLALANDGRTKGALHAVLWLRMQ